MSKKEEPKKKSFFRNDEQDEKELGRTALGDLASFRFLFFAAKPYWGKLAISLLFTYVGTSLGIGTAYTLGYLIEHGLMKQNLNTSLQAGALIIVLEALGVGCTWFGRRLMGLCSSLTILEVRRQLFSKLSLLPMNYFDHQPQGRVVTRLTHDVEGIEEFFTSSMSGLFVTFFAVINTMIAMLSTDHLLGGYIIAAMMPALVLTFVTKKKVRNLNRAMSKTNSATSAKLSEYLDGIEVIRSFGIEKYAVVEYEKKVDENLDANIRANRYFSYLRPVILLFCVFPLLSLIYFGGMRVLTNTMSIALFVAFIRLCERFSNPIMRLAREIHVIQQAFTSAERVASFLNEPDENQLFGANPQTKLLNDGRIEFNNVWMKYDQEWILKGLSLLINNGETVGIVGRTGCGKTTTMALLSRLYDYQKGEIYIGSQDLKMICRNSLRERIGVVSQDVIIFKGPLRDNLTMGAEFSDQEVLDACVQTGLKTIMDGSGLTFDSTLFEGGGNLSVGERQLLSLTRILLKNPLILILDEATANIDPHYERIIQDAIAVIMKNRTCLMIAHRLSTLEKCDRIIVLERGVLVEQGTISQLLEQKGHYYNLHDALFSSKTVNTASLQ